jgi:3-hydroxyisobutyrate dehydrogenase-like beta-hydroxyacid dehydrogenase
MGERVAFLGLGVMGFPMAGHLAVAGYDVAVYNRNRARAEQWLTTHRGTLAETPATAARGARAVFVCVGKDEDVRAVVLGPSGALAGMEAGACIVDHTTASAALARELWQIARGLGVGFIDAPVSGGQAGAEGGKLTIMCGGDAGDFAAIEPFLAVYARAARLMGPAGTGQLSKMVNQICIAGVLEGLAEGLHFARRAGLDVAAVVDVISRGAAQSWQMDNRARTMNEDKFGFGFAVNWMRKDLALCLDEATRIGARLPVTALVDQFYGDVQQAGGGRWDTSSLITRLNG